MSKAGLDNRHRNKDGEISDKYGNTLIRTFRKVYGQSFAAGYHETQKLSEVLLKLTDRDVTEPTAVMRPVTWSARSRTLRCKSASLNG